MCLLSITASSTRIPVLFYEVLKITHTHPGMNGYIVSKTTKTGPHMLRYWNICYWAI